MNTQDAVSLINAKREVKVPFKLLVQKMGDGEVELKFLSILRLLPSKRIVALADYEGEEVLVKTYLGRTANKNAFRERVGVLAIAQSGVNTPDLLWEGEISGGRVLVFRYLPDAISLAEQWASAADSEARVRILSVVMKVIASLHKHGVIQNDIHLANFLLSNGRINTIDGGAVEHRGEGSLTEAASLKNLALFFAQFYPRFDVLIDQVFKEYVSCRQWDNDEALIEKLRREVLRCREERKHNYIEKSFRDCTRFRCRTSLGRFEVSVRDDHSMELAQILEDPDKFIETGTLLKDGNSATVALVQLGGRSYVVKRYNVKNFMHGLRRSFRKSRAWHAWGNAHRLDFLGISAMKPVAMVENKWGPIRKSAYLVTEYIDAPDMLEWVQAGSKQNDETKRPAAELEAIITLIRELSEAEISHGDLKATNFLMGEGGPVLIDLDGMKDHKNHHGFKQAFRRDLIRFMDNWQEYPGLRASFATLLKELSVQYNVSLLE
jgi:tRNA A-37 threonylcarbamoyl transferase component Bud32